MRPAHVSQTWGQGTYRIEARESAIPESVIEAASFTVQQYSTNDRQSVVTS